MTPYEYYSNLIKYKKKDVSSKLYDGGSLEHGIKSSIKNLATHANTMKNYGYYNKLDNFYGPGKARYFYSKDEWDAYQREKNRIYDKAKANQTKAEEERIKKYGSNVEKAQLARKNEEQKATLKETERQTQNLKDEFSRNTKVINNLLKLIQDSGGNTNDAIKSLLKESLDDNYGIIEDNGKIMIGYHVVKPRELWDQIKKLEDEKEKLRVEHSLYAYDDYNKKPKYGWEAYDEEYKKQKANLDYEIQTLYKKFQNNMYKDIMDAIDNLVENNDPRKTAAIKKALWEYTNTKSFENYRKKIDDDLYRRIKSYAVIMPNDSNTETWDNSKNIKTWDNGTTLYEDILKEKKI